MELRSIDIEHYKNLRNCHIDFSDCGRLAVVAGVNGSGKSNFLEAIALVYHRFIRESRAIAKIDGCRLKCYVAGSEYDVYENEHAFFVNGIEHRFSVDARGNLIVVYSGEFNRLLHMGFVEDLDGSLPIRNVVLISAQSYQLLLLTKVLIERRSHHEHGAGILSLPLAIKLRFDFEAASINLGTPPEDEFGYFFRELLARNGGSRNSREELSLDEFDQIMRESNPQWDTIDATTVYFALTQLACDHSKGPGIYNLQIVFDNNDDGEFTSDDLSEGEKWLVMYDAIYSCMADEDTLVLLDEPDAYIHEVKKRDFVRFIEGHANRGVFTVMTTHSPNIINAISGKSLFGCVRGNDGYVTIKAFLERNIGRELLDNRMNWFSTRPIVLVEGVSDVKLIYGALDFYADNIEGYRDIKSTVDFDFVTVGSADNMVEAYRAYRASFGERRVYIVLDHDGKGREVCNKLCESFSLRTFSTPALAIGHDAVFQIPRPVHLPAAEQNWVMEDYLPPEYIQEKVQEHVAMATSFYKVQNSQKVLKTEIGCQYRQFTAREWLGFKPLIDFLAQLPR